MKKYFKKLNYYIKNFLNRCSKSHNQNKNLLWQPSCKDKTSIQYKLSVFSYIYIFIFLFEIVICLILWKLSLKKIKDSIPFIFTNVIFIISSLLICVSAAAGDSQQTTEHYQNKLINKDHFTHTWAVHIPNGNKDNLAHRIALEHGFTNLGKIFDDHYHFQHKLIAKRSILASHSYQNKLDNDERIHWSLQQKVLHRTKRDFQKMIQTSIPKTYSLDVDERFRDPKWSHMWYLNRGGGLDMNVIPAWKEGITGKGIVVTILDDGLETDHPDLEHNYDRKASYDVNSHDDDPMPHYDMTDSNRHGTRCAGEVAATANNTICAVGIAFGAKVGGVRMLDGDVTDAVEARSLSLQPQHIDIYSASWGPDDDGKTVDGPGELASRAFIEGVTKGRKGKGSIFVWASGNGGRELDNCNCDGYTNSIWTLSISSATEEGHVPWYSEKCSSTLATTYSSGGQSEKQVVTTDLHHTCTVSHTGTSASAPLAAGIVALVLEANQNLTWRDLQHIVVRTSKPNNLIDPTWSTNGVGRKVSHSFGYGLMDAAAMVRLARKWKTVPEQQRCEINAPHVDKMIPAKSYITLQLSVKHCVSVNFLEHVQAKVTLTSQRRGDIQIYLISPAGTKVTLLTSRVHDSSRSGFNQWPFMSVHTWGETPHGNWLLEIHNEGKLMAQITQWDLIFYGTQESAQVDDNVKTVFGQFKLYSSDVEKNLLTQTAETSSKQWRNTQQVGESDVEIQLSHLNDQASSACLSFLIDQRCVAFNNISLMCNGRCFARCPDFANDKNNTDENNFLIVLCLNCDATCLKCTVLKTSGFYLTCPLKIIENYLNDVKTNGTDKYGYKFFYWIKINILNVIVIVIVLVVILVYILYLGNKFKFNYFNSNSKVYNYDRIALDVLVENDDSSNEDSM